MAEHFDIIIVGGGPAGLTAALYARRAGKSVLLLEKESFGGQIASSPRVDNYPGLTKISGAELADRFYEQAETQGAQIELEEVQKVNLHPGSCTVTTDYGTYEGTALILATGLHHRQLGLQGESTLSGISYCAVCDGSFYKGKDVAVCGGGNTALGDALFLSSLCQSVAVIHRRGEFRGDKALVDMLKTRDNVTFILHSVVEHLEGSDALTGLTLHNLQSDEISHITVSGLFEAVGQQPERRLSESLVSVDDGGFVRASEDCKTSRPGVFVAGDCRTKEIRQLTTALSDGATAAIAACQFCDQKPY